MVYSSAVKNFSIHSVNYVNGENNDTEDSSDDDDVADYETDDENEDNEENEENEEQELDGESDYIEDLGYLALSEESERNHYTYFLSKSSLKKKEHFTPPEVIV